MRCQGGEEVCETIVVAQEKPFLPLSSDYYIILFLSREAGFKHGTLTISRKERLSRKLFLS